MSERELFDRVLDVAERLESVSVRPDGSIVDANAAFARHVKVERDRLIGRAIANFLTAGQMERFDGWIGDSPPPDDPVRVNFAAVDGTPFTLRCVVERSGERLRLVGEGEAEAEGAALDELMRLNNELATMARERARRERELERTRDELEKTLEELRTSYWHLQKIQEALPICMGCERIKSGDAPWSTVTDYLKENRIFLSHGYCPECAAEYERRHGLE